MEGVGPIQVSLAEISAGLLGTSVAKKPFSFKERIAEPLLESALNPVMETDPSLATPRLAHPFRGQNLNITV